MTLYTISQAGAWPYSITPGPDGNLWFSESNANQIAKITPSGVITEYTIPTLNSMPRGIATGPDSNIWFTEYAGNKIGRITTGIVTTPTVVPTLQRWALWPLGLLILVLAAGPAASRSGGAVRGGG